MCSRHRWCMAKHDLSLHHLSKRSTFQRLWCGWQVAGILRLTGFPGRDGTPTEWRVQRGTWCCRCGRSRKCATFHLVAVTISATVIIAFVLYSAVCATPAIMFLLQLISNGNRKSLCFSPRQGMRPGVFGGLASNLSRRS
jgi:hypothetical protein